MSSHDAALTGYGTAALRAVETVSGTPPLIVDHVAKHLAKNIGYAWIESLDTRTYQLMLDLIAVRTRFIDDVCDGFMSKIRVRDQVQEADLSFPGGQIVLLGSGFDTRAYRMTSITDAAIFEIDYEMVLNVKRNTLRAHDIEPICRDYSAIGVDFSHQEFITPLVSHGFLPSSSALWIVEGLTGYLSAQDNSRLLSQMSESSAPGSQLVVTFVTGNGEAYGRGAGRSKRHRFFTKDAVGFVRAHGWDCSEERIGVIAERYARATALQDYDYSIVHGIWRS